MADHAVCLHYKEADVSASFKVRLTPALAKAPALKLLKWFAKAEAARSARRWDPAQLALVDLKGRSLDLDAPMDAQLAAAPTDEAGELRLIVRPWLRDGALAALRAPKVADAWALFCPIEKLVVYDRLKHAKPCDSLGLSDDDVFYLRFLRKLRGSGFSLGSERVAGFKKLTESEDQGESWKRERRFARRGAIPRAGARVVDVDSDAALFASMNSAVPALDGGGAPVILKKGATYVAASYGVSPEHELRWGEHATGDSAQLFKALPRWLRIEYADGDAATVTGYALQSTLGKIREPPDYKRVAGETSSSSDDDGDDDVEAACPRPPGISPKFWRRFLAACEWKADGDRLLAQRGLRARDAVLAYDLSNSFVGARDVADAGASLLGDAWACRRLAPLLRAVARATALNGAVALLASGESQACLDALARPAPNPGLLRADPDDVDALFCRAEALGRLRFPGLALDQLNALDAAVGSSLDAKKRTTLEAAIQSAADKVAALKAPRRKTKKRW